MYVTEGQTIKTKVKLKSRNSCKALINKSIVEERLIKQGMKKYCFCLFKKKAEYRKKSWADKGYCFSLLLQLSSVNIFFFQSHKKHLIVLVETWIPLN